MAEDELKLRVVLDPQGLQSQLAQLKQEVGLTVQGALANAGGSISVATQAAGMMAGDVHGALDSVLHAPRAPDDVSVTNSAMYATFPGVSAPHSYDVKRFGQMHAERVSTLSGNYAMNLTHGIGKTMADWGAFEVGMAGVAAVGAIAGAPVMGLGSLGAIGMGAAGMAGGMAAGYAGGEAYDKMFSRSIVGSASRGIVQNLGERFGAKPSEDIIAGVQSIHAGGGYGVSETTSTLSAGLQFGVFGQVRGVEDFKEKFSSLMKGAKEIAQTMNVGMEEAVQSIAQMQGAGFGSIDSAVQSLQASRLMARSTGIPGAEANELMLAGASMTMGTGFSASFGASSTLANYEAVTMGLRAKQGSEGYLGMESVMQLGGRNRAAQAMTQANMKYLEGPMGRATLLGAYDPETGLLDPGRSYNVQPGMAYRNAVDTLRGSDNPMAKLLEFVARRDSLKSKVSPEEAALGQVGMGAALARMTDPKGPITKEMVVGAMIQMGSNPETAETQYSQVTNAPMYVKRLQDQRMELSRTAQAQNSAENSLLHNIGQGAIDTVSGIGGAVADAAAPYTPDIIAGVVHGAGEVSSGLVGKIKDTAGAAGGYLGRAARGARELWSGKVQAVPAVLRRQHILDRITGKELGNVLELNRGILRAEEGDKAREDATVAIRAFVYDNADTSMFISKADEGDVTFFAANMADFETYARLGPGSKEGQGARQRLEKASKGYGSGSVEARAYLIENMGKFKNTSAFTDQMDAVHRHLSIESASVQARDVLEVLGGAAGDTEASKAFRAYEATFESKGMKGSLFAGVRRAVMAAVDDPAARGGRFGRVLEDVGKLRDVIQKSKGGAVAIEDLEKMKLSTISTEELKAAAGKDAKLDYTEVIAQAMVEIGVTSGKGKRGAAVGGAVAYTGANQKLFEMIDKTGRALDGVTELLESLKANPSLFPR